MKVRSIETPLALQIKKFQVSYPDFRISADFSVLPNQRLALIGPSGCGKTTLLRWIAGFDVGVSKSGVQGSLILGEQEMTQKTPEQRGFGWVSQEPALFPSLSVMENVEFGLRVRQVPKAERQHLAREALKAMGLGAKVDAPAHILSGGEKQRVAFLRSIIWKPQALLLDEPFSALDPSTRSDVRKALVEMHREWSVPLILVTHDREDVEAVATRQILAHQDESRQQTEFMQSVS